MQGDHGVTSGCVGGGMLTGDGAPPSVLSVGNVEPGYR